MGTLNVAYAKGASRHENGEAMPVFDGKATAENITTSASSAAGSLVAKADGSTVRVSTDTTVWVVFGPTPTAVVGTGFLIQAGATEFFGVGVGDQTAAIDA